MPEPPISPDNAQLLQDRDNLELRLLPVSETKKPSKREMLQQGELPLWLDSEQLLQRGLPWLDRDNKRHWQQREQLLLGELPPLREGSKCLPRRELKPLLVKRQ